MPRCVYEDEHICILDPKDPESEKKGVLLIHTIGFMEPIGSETGKDLFTKVKKEGLKSSGRLLENKGVAVPVRKEKKPSPNLNSNSDNESNNEGMNFNAASRKVYLEADKDHFNRIFFRPPFTAPFVYEDGKFRSKGPWKDFLGTEEEAQLFFGGSSLERLAKETTNPGFSSGGIAIVRVDPKKTFVFYEAVKDAAGDYNKATGQLLTGAMHKKTSKEQRFMDSRIRLSDYLDQLEKNLKGEVPEMSPYAIKPNQIIEPYWEVMATTPNLPSSVFVGILSANDPSLKAKDTEEYIEMRQYGKELRERIKKEGYEKQDVVDKFVDALYKEGSEMRRLIADINKSVGWEVKAKGKYKTEEAKKEVIRDLQTKATAELQRYINHIKEASAPFVRDLNPIQKDYFTEKRKGLEISLKHAMTTISLAKEHLGIKAKAKGGTRSQKHKTSSTRKRGRLQTTG